MTENGNHRAQAAIKKSPVADVVAGQRGYFQTGATRPVARRVELLQSLLRGLEAREDAILQALESDLGKPGVEAWLAEVKFLRDDFKLAIRKLKHWARPQRVGQPVFLWPARSWMQPEPFGVVLVIAPWNYPLQLALSPAIAAIAAGNCVTLKPSEHATATAALIAEWVAESCPAGQVSVVCGDKDVGEQLLEQPFDLFFFTGGSVVGGLVAQAAARQRVPAVLELGGKSPAVVDASADLAAAAERIALGKFFNAGQTCMAPDFVAVEESVKADFMAHLRTSVESAYGGDAVDLSRMVHREQYDRVRRLAGDAAVVIGEDDPGRLHLAPRLIEADWSHPAMQEEVFGPLLPVVGFADRDELINKLRAMPEPLALYVFSANASWREELPQRVRSGSVCFNDVMKQAMNFALPFGGVGASGYGVYRGEHGFRTFSQARAYMRRYNLPDPFRLAPPYGNLLEKLRRWL